MINNIQILGRVGKKTTNISQSGKLIANLTIATNKKIKNANGQKETKTSWHHVTVFNKLAEIVQNYVNVGELIYVEGEIDYGKYTSKDGIEHNKTTVIARDIKMFPKSLSGTAKNHPENRTDGFQDDDIPF